MKPTALIALAGLFAAVAISSPLADENDDPGGTLNPDEMSLNSALSKAARGDVGMVVCAQGYLVTKSGRHEEARTIFKNCAQAGYTGAMTWMSQLDDNGLGAPEDPAAAAEWDLRAAEAGDPIGLFNYGLDLMRGRGVDQDEALGRAYVDRAADNGVGAAQRLQASDYDLDVVTPDADNWKYRKNLF